MYNANQQTVLQLTSILEQYRFDYWHRENQRYEFCDVLFDALGELPAPDLDSIVDMVLQWPHRAISDTSRIGFTESERKGEADRQTLTTIGRYLRRYFSSKTCTDEQIKQFSARMTLDQVVISSEASHFWLAITQGPRSCMTPMSHGGHYLRSDCMENHPYKCYSHKHGWAMAIRFRDGRVDGRCLVNMGSMQFVRSYKLDSERDYSYTDEALEAQLKKQGYQKVSCWAGHIIEIEDDGSDSALAPYIDGDSKYVTASGYITDDESDAEWECGNANGWASRVSNRVECSECYESFTEREQQDGIWAGYNEGSFVCNSCSNDYVMAIGRYGRDYWVRDENCIITMDGDTYDQDYLEYNNIHYITHGEHKGEYAEAGDLMLCENGDVWHIDCWEDQELTEDESN